MCNKRPDAMRTLAHVTARDRRRRADETFDHQHAGRRAFDLHHLSHQPRRATLSTRGIATNGFPAYPVKSSPRQGCPSSSMQSPRLGSRAHVFPFGISGTASGMSAWSLLDLNARNAPQLQTSISQHGILRSLFANLISPAWLVSRISCLGRRQF